MDQKLEQRSVIGCELVADVARSFGEVRLRVTGASMLPAVWPGDVIIVRDCDSADLQPGNIVLYKQQDKLVAHRITRLCGNLLITRGDSLRHDDPPVKKANILGQVVRLVRNGRVVNPSQSLRLPVGSRILQRSDFCKRMALHLVRRLQRLNNGGEIAWVR
jgi:signal peptidase I